MESKDIRRLFIEFFEGKGHVLVQSSSLVPFDDPTLLFTSAGMVQFKQFWSTDALLPYKRAVSCQKCMRAGGKDSDLENVGTSGRHHTFFEMLGNFSFGDYFKEEAIQWAYEFAVDELKIPPGKIWVTYYQQDIETKTLWEKYFPTERIVPLGDKDNFWGPVGDSGPCGPCTELYLDTGEEKSCGPECKAGCDCERFVEFWNLVFQQYDKRADGSFVELSRKGVDTGMGLERIAAIMQQAPSNYETDLFLPIIKEIEKIAGTPYEEGRRLFRIISDHLRASVFLIGDNVLPENDGRGYVLRRIVRRALLSGINLGVKESFFYRLSGTAVDIMKDDYPYLYENRGLIKKILLEEEEKFHITLSGASRAFQSLTQGIKDKKVSGKIAFKLYDTHGIPKDTLEELAEHASMEIDWNSFEKELKCQKEQSRTAGDNELKYNMIYEAPPVVATVFTGYEKLEETARITAVYESADKKSLSLVPDKSPFYPEKGGQIGDKGLILGHNFRFKVIDTRMDEKELIHHMGVLEKGTLADIKSDGAIEMFVDADIRKKVSINHTATHLLHYAIRKVLGSDIKQAGSFVGHDKLRFDFVCSGDVSAEQVNRIEDIVQENIFKDNCVSVRETGISEAVESGAIALFMEKYKDEVRVINLGDYHVEVCGGTHISRTGGVVLFKITGFESVGKNLKRVEAVTYKEALGYFERYRSTVAEAGKKLNVEDGKVLQKVDALLSSLKEKEKLIAKYEEQIAVSVEKRLLDQKYSFKAGDQSGFFVSGRVDIDNQDSVSRLADKLLARIEEGIVLIAAEIRDRLFVVIKVSEKFKKVFPANMLIKEIAEEIQGGGGGSPVFARGSGKISGSLKEAFEKCKKIIGSS